MAEDRGERRPYAGGRRGGNHEKRPYTAAAIASTRPVNPDPSRVAARSRATYTGTPRFKRDASAPPAESGERPTFTRSKSPRFRKLRASRDAGGETRPRFDRADKPAFGGKPRFGGKPVRRQASGFKKKFTGKAAGAKGSYKGGKAERAKRGVWSARG
jgi:hypothetical protein